MVITTYKIKLALLILMCIFVIKDCVSQSHNTKPYILLQKGKVEKAEKEARDLLEKDEENALAYYVLSEVLFQLEPRKYLDSYNMICQAQNLFRKNEENIQKENWKDDGFTLKNIRETIKKVCHYAALEVESQKSIDLCLEFLDTYNNAPQNDINRIESLLYELAFNESLESNTTDSWSYFIENFPLSPRIREAFTYKEMFDFENAISLNTIDEWRAFIRNNPNSANRSEAKSILESLEYENAVEINAISEFARFITSYPYSNNKSKAEELRDNLEFAKALSTNKIFDLKDFKQKRPNSHLKLKTDSILGVLEYAVYVDAPSLFRLKNYISNYPSNKNYEILLSELISISEQNNSMDLIIYAASVEGLNTTSEIAIIEGGFRIRGERGITSELNKLENDIGNLLDRHPDYISSISELKSLISESPEYLTPSTPEFSSYISRAHHEFSFAEKMYLRSYVAFLEFRDRLLDLNDHQIANTLSSINSIDLNNWWLSELVRVYEDPIAISRTLKGKVNSDLGEYVPTPTSDGRNMYYCLNDTRSENIFMSNYENGTWGKGQIISDLSSDNSNDAPLNISTDGMELILFRSGEIMKSEKTSSGWSTPYVLSDLNIGSWNAGAQLVSTKEAMIFTSVISDDNPHKDIFVSLIERDGEFSTPINIGPVINTSGNDRTPFLHPDMKTLYFSSTGHGGIGDMDVFMSKRLNDSCWTCWSTPVNLGRGINTSLTDWGFKISTDGTTAYFAQDNPGHNQDLYEVNLTEKMKPDLVATVEGKVLDKYNQPVEAKIIWENLETEEIIGEAQTDPVDGSYFIVLPTGNVYGYFVEIDGFYPTSSSVDLSNQTKFSSISEDIDMVFTEDVIEGKKDAIIPVNNIFFSIGSDELLSISNSEIKRLSEFINTYNRSVVLSGHTDNTGTIENNQILSEKRANSVKQALINLGCNKEQLQTKGYGEMNPVASNDSKLGRQKNRRVELTFAN